MGNWIQTFSGKRLDIFNPKEEDICIEDIAHGLALKCRFNGQCNKFYSVAEHCVRMSLWDLPGSPEWRLMHDAGEAYLPDIPRPIKQNMEYFQLIENNILNIISSKFHLSPYNQNEIKKADEILLATEARDLMGDPQDWSSTIKPYKMKINPWIWRSAEILFLHRAKVLGIYV